MVPLVDQSGNMIENKGLRESWKARYDDDYFHLQKPLRLRQPPSPLTARVSLCTPIPIIGPEQAIYC